MSAWNKYNLFFFLDEGLGIKFGFSKSETTSKFVLNTLVSVRFFRKKEKSVWEPTIILTWLGISANLKKGVFMFPKNVFQIY